MFLLTMHNGLRLCDGGELEAQMFNLQQMFIIIPNVQFSPKAHNCKTRVSGSLFFSIFLRQLSFLPLPLSV